MGSLFCLQIKSLGYEPVVVLSQADRECAECKVNTLGNYPVLDELKHKVRAAELVGSALQSAHHSLCAQRIQQHSQHMPCLSAR